MTGKNDVATIGHVAIGGLQQHNLLVQQTELTVPFFFCPSQILKIVLP